MTRPRSMRTDGVSEYIDRFRAACESYPAGLTYIQESPDCRVGLERGFLGIEVTRVYRPPVPGRQPLQAAEANRRRTVHRAEQLYAAEGGPLLRVCVDFNDRARLTKKTIVPTAAWLAKRVAAEHVAPGAFSELHYGFEPVTSFPEEISWISIYRPFSLARPIWAPANAGCVPPLAPDLVQSALDRKERHVAEYRRGCAELWLLAVVDGFSISAMFDIPSTTLQHVYQSGFDRAFLFDNFGKREWSLLLDRSGSSNEPTGAPV